MAYYFNRTRKEYIYENKNIFKAIKNFPKYYWSEEDDINVSCTESESDCLCLDYDFIDKESACEETADMRRQKRLDFIQAVEDDDLEKVRSLDITDSKYDFNINTEFEDSKTLLMFACENENIDMIKELFRFENIKISYRNKLGKSAMTYALVTGNEEVIDFLGQYITKVDR
jgi:ankyrin repeat protein